MPNCLASFQNSRIRPRNATTTAQTGSVTISNVTETTIRPANVNRTYMTLRNLDSTNPIRYGYPAQYGTLSVDGFLLKAGDAVDLESTEEIRAIASGGSVISCWDEGSG